MKRYLLLIFIALLFVSCSKAQRVDSFPIHPIVEAEYQPTENETIRNVILLIGDGMGIAEVYAGMTANKGRLNMELCPYTGFSKTQSADDYITDSAAGGTAIATGTRTNNLTIAMDTVQKPLKTILEIAEENGLSTGLVATSKITHATPASFIAHNENRNNYEAIAADFLKTDIDVFIGGGYNDFAQRSDGEDLIKELERKSYNIAREIDELSRITSGKLAALLYPDHPPKYTEGRGEMLTTSAKKAIELLSQNKQGFFLMVEGSQIDWGGHANDAGYIINETLDFDRMVGAVLEFAARDQHTLVIITADHETSGLGLNGGDIEAGAVEAAFTTDVHTGVPVPVFAFGPKAELFTGIYDNTQIFHKMREALGL